jgi:2-succinyl-5-enolpyruvyl-6-hydroxy-3-cyclohexene-1-carboxylate synthase
VSVQATFSATLVDEWCRLGVTDAVVCPGSRSTPLALALAARLQVHVRLDERSGAFFALGLAQATGRPTVVCVTSGTAAAELHAAVVEAHHARVPLIVCTADRPPELHHVGAPQTIEQAGLFRAATRWEADPGVAHAGQARSWRSLATRAHAESMAGPAGPGPVHLNLAFREPLTGVPGPLPPPDPDAGPPGATEGATPSLEEALGARGVLVVGRPPAGRALDPQAVTALGSRLGWPVFADPLSGCRVPGTIAAADAIVRTHPPRPECVVLLGSPWLSRPLGDYLAAAAGEGARVVAVDPWGEWADPQRIVTERHRCRIEPWLAAATAAAPVDPAWLTSWLAREERAQDAITRVLGDELNEPQVARSIHRWAARSGATLVTSASMPIRDLECYAAPEQAPPRVLANRGANGIDGVVSTAFGVAAADPDTPTVALLGDLALLHDVSALVNVPRVPCTLVVVDNGGGGIFSFLPQAGAVEPARFEQLFGTPPASDVVHVARGFGLPSEDVASLPELERALDVVSTSSAAGPPAERRPPRGPQRAGGSDAGVSPAAGVGCRGEGVTGPVSAIAGRRHPLPVAARREWRGKVDDRLGSAVPER